jgi:hypothetical protein
VVGAAAGLELYVVAAYLAGGLLPYLWRHQPVPATWLLLVPGWLLGFPGWFITVAGPELAVPVAIAGLATLAVRRTRWTMAAALLTGAYAVFSLTPLAHAVAVWTLD